MSRPLFIIKKNILKKNGKMFTNTANTSFFVFVFTRRATLLYRFMWQRFRNRSTPVNISSPFRVPMYDDTYDRFVENVARVPTFCEVITPLCIYINNMKSLLYEYLQVYVINHVELTNWQLIEYTCIYSYFFFACVILLVQNRRNKLARRSHWTKRAHLL